MTSQLHLPANVLIEARKIKFVSAVAQQSPQTAVLVFVPFPHGPFLFVLFWGGGEGCFQQGIRERLRPDKDRHRGTSVHRIHQVYWIPRCRFNQQSTDVGDRFCDGSLVTQNSCFLRTLNHRTEERSSAASRLTDKNQKLLHYDFHLISFSWYITLKQREYYTKISFRLISLMNSTTVFLILVAVLSGKQFQPILKCITFILGLPDLLLILLIDIHTRN